MEQIVMYSPSKPNESIALENREKLTRITRAEQRIALLGEDVVNLTIESPYPQDYEIGAKIHVFGREYTMNQLPVVKKDGMHSFSYELTFEGVQYELSRVQYEIGVGTENNEEIEIYGDDLMGNFRIFMDVLIKNMDRVFKGKWQLGTCPETDYRNLTFGSENCLAVLQRLCEEFEQEFEIEQEGNVNKIHIRESGKTINKEFQYGRGKGFYELNRQNVSSDNIVTRLWVFGGTENLGPTYKNDRLCLPKSNKITSHIDHDEAMKDYGVWEATKYFDDIYPTMTRKVTKPGKTVYEFTDTALNMIDLNALESDGVTTKYLIDGVLPKVHFNTGNLAGYQFEVNYDHPTRTFKMKKLTDERGMTFPSETSKAFQLEGGEEYVLLDIKMPESVIKDAEDRLSKKGNEYLEKNCQPKVQYSLTFQEAYLKKYVIALAEEENREIAEGEIVNVFGVGDYIKVVDTDIKVNKTLRITSFTREILSPYTYVLTIGDTVHGNLYSKLIAKLNKNTFILNKKYLTNPAIYKFNWLNSQSMVNRVFDVNGKYHSELVSLANGSVSRSMLTTNARTAEFVVKDILVEANYDGKPNSIKVHAGTLAHHTIEDSYRIWSVTGITTSVVDSNAVYYVHAGCLKTGERGYISIDSYKREVDSDSGFYYFLLGTLQPVKDGKRTTALTYGADTINGKYLQSGRIGNATSYFDLDAGEMVANNVKFMSTDSKKYVSLSDLESNTNLTLSRVGSLERKVFSSNPSKVPGIGGNDGDDDDYSYVRTYRFRDEEEAKLGFILSTGEEMEGVEYDFINETDFTATIRTIAKYSGKAIYWRNLPATTIVLPGKFARVHLKSVLPEGNDSCSWLIMNTSDFVTTEVNGEKSVEYIMM